MALVARVLLAALIAGLVGLVVGLVNDRDAEAADDAGDSPTTTEASTTNTSEAPGGPGTSANEDPSVTADSAVPDLQNPATLTASVMPFDLDQKRLCTNKSIQLDLTIQVPYGGSLQAKNILVIVRDQADQVLASSTPDLSADVDDSNGNDANAGGHNNADDANDEDEDDNNSQNDPNSTDDLAEGDSDQNVSDEGAATRHERFVVQLPKVSGSPNEPLSIMVVAPALETHIERDVRLEKCS